MRSLLSDRPSQGVLSAIAWFRQLTLTTSGLPVNRPESLARIELPGWRQPPGNAITGGKVEFWEKVQLPSLLRQTDFAHQLSKPRIRTQRVELEVSVQTY